MDIYWIITEGNDPAICADGEFGVCVNGVPYIYYKYPDAQASVEGVKFRKINKREFGEVIRRPELHTVSDNVTYKVSENYKDEFKSSKGPYICM